ncbi:MAG: hypothetical protein NPIRA05_00430 [Nitrospirales bacterium]|nr:MAG: hypothetical protein NPIRA05_00430 [Nitrospirales bacterium]
MQQFYRIAAAVGLVLIMLEAVFPVTMGNIPLAGNALQQTAILFLIVFVTVEIVLATREIIGKVKNADK